MTFNFLRNITLSLLLITTLTVANDTVVSTGSFRITGTLTEITGEASARAAEVAIPIDERISWEVFVPESYSPDNPPGLLVYISPAPSGKILYKWKPVLNDQNLIWIAANNSGNKVPVARRAIFAVTAVEAIKKNYSIDPERVYLSGFSGGGKTAGMVAPGATDLFKGAIYIGGGEFWKDYPHDPVEQIQANHYVFVTGTEDFNLDLTRKIYRQYKKAGVENSKLIVSGRMGHRLPEPPDFTRAIKFLDSRLAPDS
jgi:predicted esterase